jgi:hypothetical protein
VAKECSVRSLRRDASVCKTRGWEKTSISGRSSPLRMTSKYASRPTRDTLNRTQNHGERSDSFNSDFPVHPSRQATPVPGSRTVEVDVWLSDDDDDIDESAIPAFSHPTMRPNTPPLNKGKSRAPEQLGLPTGSVPPNQISGNIGTPIASASRGARRNFGGVQVESR